MHIWHDEPYTRWRWSRLRREWGHWRVTFDADHRRVVERQWVWSS